jgi:hypothetical protein
MPSTCPTCGGYLAFYVSHRNNIGEEIPADLRCIYCGTSVIHFPHPPGREKGGSGYSDKKEPIKKVCPCGCKKEFIDLTSNRTRKFFNQSHKSKYGNLINNQKRVRDDETRKIERIKAKVKRGG